MTYLLCFSLVQYGNIKCLKCSLTQHSINYFINNHILLVIYFGFLSWSHLQADFFKGKNVTLNYLLFMIPHITVVYSFEKLTSIGKDDKH